MPTRLVEHISVGSPPVCAIELLDEIPSLNKQQLKTAMTNGSVWLESQHGIKRIRRAKKLLNPDDVLHIYYDEDIQTQKTEPAILIADEGDYSIWNKPYGMYSQGSKWGDHCTIYRWAERHLSPERPAFLVHRLDRAASGLIILAHNKKTTTAFLNMFKQRSIVKHYQATVEGDCSNIKLPHVIDEPLDGKSAETIILKASNNTHGTTDLLLEIKTGRKHQIRRHLSAISHPIVGDRLYGADDISQDLQLRSAYLSFVCPVTGTNKEYSLL